MMRGNYLNRGGKGADRFQKGRRAQNFFPTIIRLFKYMRRDLWGLLFSILIASLSVILSVQAPKILGNATTVIFDGVTKSLKIIPQFKLTWLRSNLFCFMSWSFI